MCTWIIQHVGFFMCRRSKLLGKSAYNFASKPQIKIVSYISSRVALGKGEDGKGVGVVKT